MSYYNRSDFNLIAKEIWDLSHGKPAVIVGDQTPNDTQYSGKFDSEPPNVVCQRYRIRLLGIDPPDKPEENLPLAYPLQLSSGLGAQDTGFIRYPPNTLVYVTQDPETKQYYIKGVVPNAVTKTSTDPELSGKGLVPVSGFTHDKPVPTTNTLNGQVVTAAEICNIPGIVSDEEKKQESKSKLPKIKSACDTANLAGVNDAILNMIKDIEELKTDLLGEDSFLGQANEFLGDAQEAVDGVGDFSLGSVTLGEGDQQETYDITIGNAAGDISVIIAAIIQEVRKWVLRKITTGANQVTGRVPLSARYIANEAMDKGLTTVTCFIAKILKNLEEMIANILKSLVDKILNATECLVENVVGGIIGTILGNLTAVINGILSKISGIIGTLSGVVGEIAELTGEMLDFVISILDLFLCKKENLCPDTSTWDFLAGSKPASMPSLDGMKIFNKAKSVTQSVANSVGNITADIKEEYDELTGEGFREVILKKDDGTEFDVFEQIDGGTIWQNIIDGGCDTDAVNCGPPNVVFFGGDGDGATGNPVVNLAGELIGVDIVTPGKYKKAPLVAFEDACGNGKGAVGTPVIGKVNDKNKKKIVYKWKEKKVKIQEGEVAKLTIIRSGRTDVTSRIRVKTLKNKGTATFNDDFKFKKEIIEFKPGETEKVFKIKARAKGEGGEGFRNTDIEGKEYFYVSIKAKKLKEEDNEGIKKLDKIKLKIKKKRKYVKVVITEDESEIIDYDDEIIDDDINEDDIDKIDDDKDPDDPDDDDIIDDDFDDDDDPDDDDDDEIGVTDVIIEDSGYGYEGYPYGDKGGGGRVWANRCQTTVHRANYDWDIPYSEGATITVYYGDEITFPGEQKILIDENFTEDKIPGCVIKGTNPKIKDMSNFDYTRGKTYETGIMHQFGFAGDAKWAMEEGFTEQDIRFFLTNKFFLRVGPSMREKLDDPEWGKIPEYSVTFTAPGCPPGTPEDPNEPPGPPDGDSEEKTSTIGGIYIKDPGFGYKPEDEVIIPGGEGKLILNRKGSITGVRITNPGIGYTTLPEIRINTNTGFNANLIPVLRFIDVNDSGFVIPLGTPTLQIIDCVGKV